MRRVSLLLVLALFLAGSVMAQPTVLGVLNSAGYMLPGMPNGGLTQGAMVTAWLGGVPDFEFAKVSSLPLATTFQGVSVQITVGSTTVDAIPMIVNATTVTFLVPSSTPLGAGTMKVTYNGQTGPPFSVEIVRGCFGMFTINQAGSGPAVMLDPTNGQPNLITNAAPPGHLWDIWGTGLGAVQDIANEAVKPLPGDLRSRIDVKVYVGGKLATVKYAGRSGCCIGIDQIRIQIPNDVSGCYVPVVVVVNGVPSNTGTISISSSSICSDPQGFNSSQLQAIQQSGEGKIARVSLSRLKIDLPGLGHQTNDSAIFIASRYSYQGLIRAQNLATVYNWGTCVVFPIKPSEEPETTTCSPRGLDPIPPDEGLDAGQVSVANSLGTKMLQLITKGTYSGSGSSFGIPSPLFLEPSGSHTIAATGGVDIPGFSVNMEFPGDLDSNINSITSVKTGIPLRITWSGSIPQSVVIMGSSTNDAMDVGAMFFCTADGAALQFTVPDYVVAAMPPSGVDENIDVGALALVAVQPTTDLAIPRVDAAFGNASNAVFHFGVAYQHDPTSGGGVFGQ